MKPLYFNLFVDCESTQPAIEDADLGRRAGEGIAAVLEARQMRGTFHVLPSELEADGELYRDLHERGHEIGLHLHPIMDGGNEFLGVHSADEQRQLIGRGMDRFEAVMGFRPTAWCPGYVSTNDATYGVAYDLGLRHGCTSMPGRTLPECASVHAGAPLDPHYAHPHHRMLTGGLDYVELPPTVDPDSKMWGGKHAQDLRIELVDAKNHWYTMQKAVERQIADATPLVVLRAITHNVFEYGRADDFRRQTLEGVLDHAARLAETHGLALRGAASHEIAAAYREAVPVDDGASLSLDRSGHGPSPPHSRSGA
jgi:peptidoglycan/xylan/chitin deacetylase (PgdA/CDA1 family)